MRRLFIIVALLGALTTAAALATGSRPITEKVLGGEHRRQLQIDVKKPGDVVVAKATVPPGASFGWHSHRPPLRPSSSPAP